MSIDRRPLLKGSSVDCSFMKHPPHQGLDKAFGRFFCDPAYFWGGGLHCKSPTYIDALQSAQSQRGQRKPAPVRARVRHARHRSLAPKRIENKLDVVRVLHLFSGVTVFVVDANVR
ncbi:hypothetical protein V5799_014824 [Amblyomma americanum]|uniref:Uncharacterized protein n=1 Tax=Amblyomma americanum TaxID=6943 RepID=A0AAQ4E1X2_AMBAM